MEGEAGEEDQVDQGSGEEQDGAENEGRLCGSCSDGEIL